MRRAVVITALLAVVGVRPSAAQPQMAAAVGKPRVDAQLPVGTATVKVVRGAIDAPITGIDVEMIGADDTTRTARTDNEGQATFPGLKASVEYKARMSITEGGNELASESEPFSVPDEGGIRLLLSPVAWKGGGDASGMPDPRRMSGIPRGEPNDPPGRITVRSVYGALADNAEGSLVHLVGYDSDGSVTVVSKPADAAGRVVFDGLSVSGRVAYYALTVLARDEAIDRVRSNSIDLPPQVGMRVVLSGQTRSSSEPPVDDLEDAARQGVAKNTVVAQVYTSSMVDEVELVELGTGKVVDTVSTAAPQPSAEVVMGSFGAPKPVPQLSDGVLSIAIVRPSPKGQQPIAGASIEVRLAEPIEGAAPVAKMTDTTGLATLEGLTPGGKYIATAHVYGRKIESTQIEMPKTGGARVSVTATWEIDHQLEARFSNVAAEPSKVYALTVRNDNGTFHSEPFQLTADRGAVVPVVVFPTQLMFQFHLNGIIEDKYMGFQGQFTLHNLTPAPFDAGKDGLLIPLPAGFIGAGVAEESQSRVSVDGSRGFVWRGTIPPGSRQFTGGFSMVVVDGKVGFDMPLPVGAVQSSLVFLYEPGMEFSLPGAMKGALKENEFGRKFYVVNRIEIEAGTRMVMSIRGLPQYPVWRKYVAYAAGLMVLGFIVVGVFAIFRRPPEEEIAAETSGSEWGSRKREELYDSLVRIEAEREAGEIDAREYDKTRSRLMAKLEANYEQRASRSRR